MTYEPYLSQPKWVCHVLDEFHTVLSIEIRELNAVKLGVHPIQPLCLVVDGEAVGPAQLSGDDDPSCTAVHEGALDLGQFAPVGPKDAPAQIKSTMSQRHG